MKKLIWAVLLATTVILACDAAKSRRRSYDAASSALNSDLQCLLWAPSNAGLPLSQLLQEETREKVRLELIPVPLGSSQVVRDLKAKSRALGSSLGKKIKKQRDEIEAEFFQLNQTCQVKGQEVGHLQEEVTHLQRAVDDLKAHRDLLIEEVGRLDHDRGRQEDETILLKEELTTLKEKVGSLQEEKAALEDNLNFVRDEVRTLQGDKQTLEQTLDDLRGQLTTTREEKDALERRVAAMEDDQLTQRIDHLEEQVARFAPTPPTSPLEATTCPTILSRSQWNARATTWTTTRPLPVEYVVIHHSATPSCFSQEACSTRVKSIQNHHIDTNDWGDIGYHFLIGGDGTVFEGRGWEREGAHARGYNRNGVGIVLLGTFTDTSPPEVQLDSARRLIQCGLDNAKIASDYKLVGHRQVSATVCPGTALQNIIKTWPHFARNP